MTVADKKLANADNPQDPKTGLKIGIPKEVFPGERRVAATPDTAKTLQKMGFEVLVESKAGAGATFSDQVYQQAGCQVVADTTQLWETADIILKVRAPQMHPTLNRHEAELLNEGKTLISFIWPAQNEDLLKQLAEQKANVLAMDAIPRISRAQKMDALSSMANIAGYRAVVESANNFGRFFTGQITAAGKVPPAKVLVIGAGVAGLAAIGAARGLGAVVRSFDTRPVVKEQVQSMGAEFLELEFEEDGTGAGGYAKTMSPEFIAAEMELFAQQAEEVDIIITTALIPGKKAPLLITKDMVESMKEGSVVVDMAAEQGGNCEVTRPNEVYQHHGVTIVGLTDLPSRMANQSSQLYGNNLCHLLKDMGGAEDYKIDFEDEVVRGATVLQEGKITWPPPQVSQPSPPKPAAEAKQPAMPAEPEVKEKSVIGQWLPLIAVGAALFGIGLTAPPSFLTHFTVFVLACFVGWQVIWNVAPALHTPLMSVTNAISGIIILGGMLQISGPLGSPTTILGAIAILVGTINIAGGFLVTQRMLQMFRR
ncbi:Re/Si-specific NAD(P)(+) transhydrogenase subunit alpha [Acaryochloris marina]|uniref:NAD(P) transhydrogenase subunit alpha n=1 Tax=Acaryochloris marina (strain MBIC 11017) TaxID=329726 RepID=B0CDX4_ACAM1|nr:Re/Si-specific NAD(P)(+) transhydrogenase subunit alpha [Acaryochloris marina]ABW29326.1 NAD(P) transhydrogenase, alpha subunit [Acaryochloris marina MBIC11017]BDM78246.1 NAD(P) transhydrogenase subunit alpha [Acaryochloris marina MBIC10699]